MEKSRKNKKIVLIFLLVLVVVLSIGFAGLSKTLTISSGATVDGVDSAFAVRFTSVEDPMQEDETENVMCGGKAVSGTISGTTLTELKAEFIGDTTSEQVATWEAYVYNEGKLDAFLNDVTIGAINCVAGAGTTQGTVDKAATGLSIKVSVDGENYSKTASGLNGKELTVEEKTEKVIVTLTYAQGAPVADGDFTVTVDPIELVYGSAD